MENPSLPDYFGAMDSEELLRKADALRSLQEHPGWDVVLELVGVQKAKATHQLVHRPMRDVQAYAHAGGYVKGLEHFEDIVSSALKTAEAVQQALEQREPAGAVG